MKKSCFSVSLAVLVGLAGSVEAASTVNLDFNGSGNTLAATGFEGVYNLAPAGFNVGGGTLSIQTLPGDIFGNYENDPDTAQNVFWSPLDTGPGTILDARVSYTSLNQNFHGGGIWMGMDTDHYIRLGVIHNGGIVVEALRENEDRWEAIGGPGQDIVGVSSSLIGNANDPISIYLRLVRDESTATAWYSFDGIGYSQVGGEFDTIVTDQLAGSTIEDNIFKVGVYAFGGGAQQATASFDYFNAVAVPEPGSLALFAAGLFVSAAVRRRLLRR